MGELFLRYALGVAQAVLIEDYPISSEINLQFYRGVSLCFSRVCCISRYRA